MKILHDLLNEAAQPKISMKLNDVLYALYDEKTDKFGYSDMGYIETADMPRKSGMGRNKEDVKKKHASIIKNGLAKATNAEASGDPDKKWILSLKKAAVDAKKWIIVEIGVRKAQ